MAEWGKLYGTLHGSPKWVALSKGPRALWVTSLSWCIDQEATEGLVPHHMLRRLDGSPAEAKRLVEVGLWDVEEEGWRFHDWLDYQRSRDKINADREAAAERQRKARASRRESRRDFSVTHAGVTP